MASHTYRIASFNVLGGANNYKIYQYPSSANNAPRTDVTAEQEANIQRGVPERFAKMMAMIRGESLDIVGLQEANNNWLPLISGLDDYGYAGGGKKIDGEGGYILYKKSRFDLSDGGSFALFYEEKDAQGNVILTASATDNNGNPTGTYHDRVCGWALLQIKDSDRYVLALDTHLHQWHCGANDDEIRRRQAVEIVAFLNEKLEALRNEGKTEVSVMLTGDMNSTRSMAAYPVFTSALSDSRLVSRGETLGTDLDSSPEFTYIADPEHPAYRCHADGWIIDFVFVGNMDVQNYRMVHTSTNICPYGAYISDHNCVIAEVFIG